jgi:hypothetical protein
MSKEILRPQNKPAQPAQKKPPNCGTGYCSCVSCVMKPQPRAWLIEFENGDEELHFDEQSVGEIHTPLYLDPPQRPWAGLTDECRKQLIQEGWSEYIAGIDDGKTFGEWMSVATESKLKEKNT